MSKKWEAVQRPGGLAITSARLFFPIKRRRRGASTPGRYPRQLSSNTFPRSERVKTKPRSIHTFRPKNRRIRAAKPQEIAVKICQCFGGPNKVVHFTGKVLDLNSHQAQSHPRQQARSAEAAAGTRARNNHAPPHQPSGPNQQRPHRRALATASPQAGAGLGFQNIPQTSVAPCPRLRRSRTRRHTWSRTF